MKYFHEACSYTALALVVAGVAAGVFLSVGASAVCWGGAAFAFLMREF